jgi:hypothetical protein
MSPRLTAQWLIWKFIRRIQNLQFFSEILVSDGSSNCTFTCKIERGEKGIDFAVSYMLARTLRISEELEPPRGPF